MNTSLNKLQQARALNLPSRESMLNREPSVQHFWETNKVLLEDAWQEWEEEHKSELILPNSSLLDKKLRHAVTKAWENPEQELDVKELFQEVTPDVYECQFFDPTRLANLRDYLEKAWDANIPIRPPYGIVLNRGGAMLDRRSEGYLAPPSFQSFYQELINIYMRPIARLLFPEVMGYDTQSFGFSILYQPTTDTSIRPHSDASAVTLNINLNLPDEKFTGSSVDFFNSNTNQASKTAFKTGTAIIHRGSVPHTAHPITSGSRTNLVFWLYGNRGQIPLQGSSGITTDAKARWTESTEAQDGFAPF